LPLRLLLLVFPSCSHTLTCLPSQDSLGHLMQSLSSASPFFVRCIKPNARKQKDDFDYDLVLNQLRYSGMLETVRIRRSGYPVRRPYEDFLFR
jgi:myosin X